MYPPYDLQIGTGSTEMPLPSTGVFKYLRMVLELAKLRITAAVTLTTATGYFMAARRFEHEMWLPLLGVFVLACGSAACNQWQEWAIDARMERTRGRPIPSGRMDPSLALFISVAFMLLGLYCLASISRNPNTLVSLGGLAVVWYNGMYTYLKRVTAFAVIPGALIGAIPPCIGYMAAGGSLHEPRIVLVALFFFVWQIPHFWLLLLLIGSEYRAAGLPTATDKFSPPQLVRITCMWMLATAAAGLAFPALGLMEGMLPWGIGMVCASTWLAVKATNILGAPMDSDGTPLVRRAFGHINAFALMVMICLSMGALSA